MRVTRSARSSDTRRAADAAAPSSPGRRGATLVGPRAAGGDGGSRGGADTATSRSYTPHRTSPSRPCRAPGGPPCHPATPPLTSPIRRPPPRHQNPPRGCGGRGGRARTPVGAGPPGGWWVGGFAGAPGAGGSPRRSRSPPVQPRSSPSPGTPAADPRWRPTTRSRPSRAVFASPRVTWPSRWHVGTHPCRRSKVTTSTSSPPTSRPDAPRWWPVAHSSSTSTGTGTSRRCSSPSAEVTSPASPVPPPRVSSYPSSSPPSDTDRPPRASTVGPS